MIDPVFEVPGGLKMTEKMAISDALERLDKALSFLEEAVEKRQSRELSVRALQDDLRRMSAERGELKDNLETANERSEKMEHANKEVSRRLGAAMESVRTVLEQHGG